MKSLRAMGYVANDRRQDGYAVASPVKSLSNGFHGDPLVVEAARAWAIAFTRQYHWPIAIAVLDRSSVVVGFPTIPHRPLLPFHGTHNIRLSLLGPALGGPTSPSVRSAGARCCSTCRQDRSRARTGLPPSAKRALSLLAAIRRQGFAERDPLVEPRSSNTIAVPILADGRVLATVGMTYFTPALDRADVVQRYVPLVKGLADNIATSVSSLQH